MADKLLKSIKFPTLPDRYVIGDSTLTEEGAAADAKATGDEITNVKSDINFIGNNIGIIPDNLITSLSSGYYSNSGPYVDNANFSYCQIDVTNISRLYIDGILHLYTPSQFSAMGVFKDSSDQAVNSIYAMTGMSPTFPIEIDVPTGATKLLLNTDYKASDYPNNITTNLVCYEMNSNMVVRNTELSEGLRKVKLVAGVIRNSGNGWEYINDSGHKPLNLSTISVDDSGRIVIGYGFTAKKVISLVATPDETFARLYSIGGSVGLDKTLFNVYALPKIYGGMVRVTSGVFDATSYASFSSVAVQVNGEIRLYHPSLSGLSSKEIFNIQASSPSYAIKLGSQGYDYVSLYVYDSNGQKITDFTGLSFDIYATRNVNARFVNANDIVDAGGNFWIYGVMEI